MRGWLPGGEGRVEVKGSRFRGRAGRGGENMPRVAERLGSGLFAA